MPRAGLEPAWSLRPEELIRLIGANASLGIIVFTSSKSYNRHVRQRTWRVDDLIKAVENSSSYRQVLIKLNLREAGGNYEQIKKYIKDHGLRTDHFKGRAWNRGLKGKASPRIPLASILVAGSSFQSFKLKKRLFNAGLKPRHCEQCGWAEISENGYLPLELDHINGNRHDNRLENLRVLCPNCHSLRPTHRSRKRAQVAE